MVESGQATKRVSDGATKGGESRPSSLRRFAPPSLSTYFFPFDGAAAAPAAAPALGVAPLAGAAAPFAGAAPALAAPAFAPPAPAAGAAPVAAAPATAPAAPSATSSLAPLPPTISLRLATFGRPKTLFFSSHFSISFSFSSRSSRVSTLR